MAGESTSDAFSDIGGNQYVPPERRRSLPPVPTEARDEFDHGPCTLCEQGWVGCARDADGTYLGTLERNDSYPAPVAHFGYYPCPLCRPKQYLRWENGCMRPNHLAGICDVCQEVGAK